MQCVNNEEKEKEAEQNWPEVQLIMREKRDLA